MPKPDWNGQQHPDQKSPFHGMKGNGHGPDEQGLGGERGPHESAPTQDPSDTSIAPAPDADLGTVNDPEGSTDTLASATLYPPSFYVGSVPPVTNQGLTPQCVAFSNAYDTNQLDYHRLGRFNQMNHSLFFSLIGGGPNGAYMTNGLAYRRASGYPELINVPAQGGYPAQNGSPDTASHKIASYTQIPLTVSAIKASLQLGHGVLVIGTWFHSWFHPLADGQLPAPDYSVGGHARWWRGWDDRWGFRMRNSWGTTYGLQGDVYEPYTNLNRLYAAYRTADI